MSRLGPVLVLGATGVSGLLFVRHVLSLPAGSQPKLTLYVRNRSKLDTGILANTDARVVEGSLDDPKALSTAMSGGVTAVVSFLGAYLSFVNFALHRTGPTPISDAMPAVFEAMRSHGIKRILALSTPGAFPQPREREVISWKWYLLAFVMPKMIVPQGNAEMAGIAMHVSQQEDLDWTVYRVPHLNEGDESLEVKAGFLGPDYGDSTELSRGSLVRWVWKEIQEGTWIKKAPIVSNP